MASVFNYFNTTKKTDCRRDRCPGHEGGIIMTSGGWGRTHITAWGRATVSLRSSTREGISTGDAHATSPQRLYLCQPTSYSSHLHSNSEVRARGIAPRGQEERKPPASCSFPRLPARSRGREGALHWKKVGTLITALNILIIKMRLFLCLEGIRGLIRILKIITVSVWDFM